MKTVNSDPIQVLDQGFVRLVSFIQPAVSASDEWTGDLEIVRNARVSHNADWRTGEDADRDEKLLKYMLNHRHTSPFEALVFTFEVKAPIFVIRQWHRHRTWSYNEVSGRYAELNEGYYVPRAQDIGEQDTRNKQKRVICDGKEPTEDQLWWVDTMHAASQYLQGIYREALNRGIPREVARMPLALNFYSRFFTTVDCHNLLHFIELRDHDGAQWEMQQYAKAILELIELVAPITVKHFEAKRRQEAVKQKLTWWLADFDGELPENKVHELVSILQGVVIE